METKGHFLPMVSWQLSYRADIKIYKFLNFHSIASIHHISCNYSVTYFRSLTEVMFCLFFFTSAQPPEEHHKCEHSLTHFGYVNDIDDQLS